MKGKNHLGRRRNWPGYKLDTSWRTHRKENTVLLKIKTPSKMDRDAIIRSTPGLKAENAVNFEKRKVYVKCTHVKQIEHYLDLLLHITLPVHTERGKVGAEFELMQPLIRRRIRGHERKKMIKRKREN